MNSEVLCDATERSSAWGAGAEEWGPMDLLLSVWLRSMWHIRQWTRQDHFLCLDWKILRYGASRGESKFLQDGKEQALLDLLGCNWSK